MHRNRRLASLSGSVFAELETAKRQVLATGRDLIDLGIGSPDQPPALALRQVLSRAALQPDAYRYAVMGTQELRAAAADWYRRRFGVVADPVTQVTDVMGSQDGWAHIFLGLVDAGDVVLVPDPGYPIYWSGPVLAGAETYPLPLLPERGFLPDLESVPGDVLQRTKALIINYPANPTAATANREFFGEVIDWARHWGIWVLHDAAYSELAFDGYRPPSFLEVDGAFEVGLEFNSLSKTFNMAGCRIGYAIGNQELIGALQEVKGHLDYGIFLPIQEAAIAALREPVERTRETAAVYQARRDVLVKSLQQAGWDVPLPRASMFCWAPVPHGYSGSREFSLAVLERAGVIVVPGTGFGPSGEGFVRIALVQPEAVLLEAVDRIERSGVLMP